MELRLIHVLHIIVILAVKCATARDAIHMKSRAEGKGPHYPAVEESQQYWKEEAQNKLFEEINRKTNNNQAKNVILFLGDGMGISTLTAARFNIFLYVTKVFAILI